MSKKVQSTLYCGKNKEQIELCPVKIASYEFRSKNKDPCNVCERGKLSRSGPFTVATAPMDFENCSCEEYSEYHKKFVAAKSDITYENCCLKCILGPDPMKGSEDILSILSEDIELVESLCRYHLDKSDIELILFKKEIENKKDK